MLSRIVVFLVSIFAQCTKYLFPQAYSLKLETIKLVGNTYVLGLRIQGQMHCLNFTIVELFKKRNLFALISPIDAYICGLILGLEQSQLILENLDNLIEYFAQYNSGYIIDPVISNCAVNLELGEIIVQRNNDIINMCYADFNLKPYLLNAFNSTDAAQIGLMSLEHCLNELNHAKYT